MKSHSCYTGHCLKLISFTFSSIYLISCSPSTPTPGQGSEEPKSDSNQLMVGSPEIRISFQDLNKSINQGNKLRVYATPLIPYPDDLKISSDVK